MPRFSSPSWCLITLVVVQFSFPRACSNTLSEYTNAHYWRRYHILYVKLLKVTPPVGPNWIGLLISAWRRQLILHAKHCVLFIFIRRVRKRLLAASCLSIRMEQLGSHWTDFHEIWCLRISRKFKFLLISDQNKRYFTWRSIYIFDHISLSSSRNEKCLWQKLSETRNTHYMFNSFFLINGPFMR
jgi:hypothetical protein